MIPQEFDTMLVFREAKKEDAENVTLLHVLSWQQNYRDSFSDDFLDNEASTERLAVWKERLIKPDKNQFVLLVEEQGVLLGFICAYFDENNKYGTLLDNLHVSPNAKGKGLGTRLISKLLQEMNNRNVRKSLYLWVLDKNSEAIDYYSNLGGKPIEKIKANDIGDLGFLKIRYVWDEIPNLMRTIDFKLKAHEH